MTVTWEEVEATRAALSPDQHSAINGYAGDLVNIYRVEGRQPWSISTIQGVCGVERMCRSDIKDLKERGVIKGLKGNRCMIVPEVADYLDLVSRAVAEQDSDYDPRTADVVRAIRHGVNWK